MEDIKSVQRTCALINNSGDFSRTAFPYLELLLISFMSILGRRRIKHSNLSDTETISSNALIDILETLKNEKHKGLTHKSYYSIWRRFNQFLVKLDKIPKTWENRVSLYCAYMIQEGLQSSTVKSYLSAIKDVLANDDYELSVSKILLNTITKSCELKK